MMIKITLCGHLEVANVTTGYAYAISYIAFPSFKIVHRTILKFTPCGAHKVGDFADCGQRQGLCP